MAAKAKRLLGVVVPVGALRGRDSSGVGEFSDIAEAAAWCAECGIGLLQLLPVNDTGFESSPYSALSAFALNPLYIRASLIPEAATTPSFKKENANLAKKFDGAERYHYYDIATAKYALFRTIYNANAAAIEKSAEKSGALGKWIAKNAWVKAYAVFRALKDEHGLAAWKSWNDVPRPTSDDIAALWNDSRRKKDCLFYAWLQKNADEQFAAAADEVKKRGIILEGDIPILMGEDSADVWAHPRYFNDEFYAGAPPDMYSPAGQNWGFPIYNWNNLAKDDYAWWKERLAIAGRYYGAYRIDHVLGFFRIWASRCHDSGASLGRFIPAMPVARDELHELGFHDDRIRWLSRPHIQGAELEAAAGSEGAREAAALLLERIGGENLFLFKEAVRGEKDIAAAAINDGAKNFLINEWNNRALIEYAPDNFVRAWKRESSRAWQSLSDGEKTSLAELLAEKDAASEKIWEKNGKKLLSMLIESSPMLPCAEDLGAVPACVPRVLKQLGILGLSVVRWSRVWEEPEQPFIPLDEYRELSVATAAVHDSLTLREWWETEAPQEQFAAFVGSPALSPVYNPGTARTILRAIAGAASRFRVFQIQDLLHLSPRYYAASAHNERINVPGTVSPFNWTYRLPVNIATLAADKELTAAIKELTEV